MVDIFGKLLGKKKSVIAMRDVSALTSDLAKPAVQVIVQEPASLSHFGGSPDLPASVAWPEKSGKKLAFLARLSLPEVHRATPIEWLPDAGALLFFYDMDQQPWGFDPKDRGSWAVLHVSDLSTPASGSAAQSDVSPIPFRHIGFRLMHSLPSYERGEVAALKFTDDESDNYSEISDLPYKGMPKHQVSGFPAPVQGDGMELECQLVSNGLFCGDSTGYNDPRAASLKPGAENWRLLLQFDSDDELDVMWGDCGTIYYWVDEQSARSGDFSGAWLVLQCC